MQNKYGRRIEVNYKRKANNKKRMKTLSEATKNSCFKGAYYDKEKKRYIRFSLSDNSKKLMRKVKRYSNRKIRRTPGIFNHSSYKKIYSIKDWY